MRAVARASAFKGGEANSRWVWSVLFEIGGKGCVGGQSDLVVDLGNDVVDFIGCGFGM